MNLLKMYLGIQSEGVLVGTPSTFILFAEKSDREISPEEIYRQAKEITTHNHVILIGANLEYPETIELIRLLQTRFHVTVEIEKEIDPQIVVPQVRIWENILWSVSVLFSISDPDLFLSDWQASVRRMKHQLQLKFMIANQKDFQETIKILSTFSVDPEITTPVLQIISSKEAFRFFQKEIIENRLLPHISNLRILQMEELWN